MSHDSIPPRWAERLLRATAALDKHPTMLDDLDELFHLRQQRYGRWVAGVAYVFDVFSIYRRRHLRRAQEASLPPYQQAKGPIMLANYLRVALRHLDRQKGYTFINLAGLAVGIACCLLMVRYVMHELSYDRFHQHADTVYRFVLHEGDARGTIDVPMPMADVVRNDYPEVEAAARLTRMWAGIMSYEDQEHRERNVFLADGSLFDILDVTFVQGHPATALNAPNSIVLTEAMARKYFGDRNPLGALLTFTFEGTTTFEVTGVVQAFPENSHFNFDAFLSFGYLDNLFQSSMADDWDTNMAGLYIRVPNQQAAASLERQLPALVNQYFSEAKKQTAVLSLQPMTAIHLHSQFEAELDVNSSMRFIYLFGGIAAIILLIACINFMNLATARSAKRGKEVGMRKVLGANRSDLMRQFLGEAVLMSFGALSLAILMAWGALPLFNRLVGRSLTLFGSEVWLFVLTIVGLSLFVGILAGSYPALYLSAFQPLRVLKGTLTPRQGGVSMRKALVVVQFALSIILLVGIFVMQRQLTFVQEKPLGYEAETLAYIVTPQRREPTNFPLYQRELEKVPGVVGVTGTSEVPGSGNAAWRRPTRAEGMGVDERVSMATVFAEGNFAETYGLEFVAGRDFSAQMSRDSVDALVLNESAARALGLTESLEQQVHFYWNGEVQLSGHVIGVVRDFHYESLHTAIEPLALLFRPVHTRTYLVARIQTERLGETLAALESVWETLAPDWPLEMHFLQDTVLEQYEEEQRLGEVVRIFTFLAMAIACLGLLGLAAFTAEQRRKEIGVRKVLGASVARVATLVARDFALLVAMACMIALPVAYVLLEQWLQNFAYRIDIGWVTPLLAAATAMLLALATVGYQALRAGFTNPVDVLREE